MNHLHVPIIVHLTARNCILENKFTFTKKNTNHSSSGIQIADDKQETKIPVITIVQTDVCFIYVIHHNAPQCNTTLLIKLHNTKDLLGNSDSTYRM